MLLASTLFFAGLTFVLFVALAAVIGGGDMPTGPSGTIVRTPYTQRTISGNASSKERILVIPVQGIISNMPEESLFGQRPGMVSRIQEMLNDAESDPLIKAVILQIDSPGGGVTASDILYHAIRTFRERSNKPVIALMDNIAASGGYYIASACDHIIAHRTTLTGSVGVIMPLMGFDGLLKKIGVEPRIIKSGKMKDMGSPYKEMDPDERKLLQDLVNESYEIFVDVVHKGMQERGQALTLEEVKTLCDGRILTGPQAHKLGFVDQIGYFQDAAAYAAQKAGIQPGDIHVVAYQQATGLFSALMTKAATPTPSTIKVEVDGMPKLPHGQLMYLWLPEASAADTK
jgi:protease-4